MKYLTLTLALFLTACGTLQVPVSKLDVECNNPPAHITLHTTDDPDQLHEWCGGHPGCMKGLDIYAPSGPTCEAVLAHEMTHLKYSGGVDRPPARHTGV